MTSKVHIIIGLFISAFLFITAPMTVSAVEYESYTVSGGDLVPQSDSGIMLLSEDYGVATVASVFPHAIPSGLKTITYWPSYTTSHEVLEISLFKFCVSDYISDNKWRDYNTMCLYGNINVQNIVGMNPYLGRLWIRNGGKKYELVNYSNWYGFEADEQFNIAEFEVGIDIYFNNKFKADSDRPLSEYSRPDLTEDNLTVVWEAFSFDCYYDNTLEAEKLDNIHSSVETSNYWLRSIYDNIGSWLDAIWNSITHGFLDVYNKFNELINKLENVRADMNSALTNIFNRLLDLHNNMTASLTSWFNTLFEKMDDEHDEIINGYDSSTNNEAVGQLNDSMTQAMEKEDAVNQQANGYVDGYTINGDGVVGYASQFLTVFPLVSSMMQSIFDSSGAFGIIFSVIFTMTIVCMFIGMFRWY